LLKLTSNPTTGYTWQIHSYDKDILYVEYKDFYPYRPEVLGSLGEQIFEINCIKSGTQN
jgi:predicted secreted protein